MKKSIRKRVILITVIVVVLGGAATLIALYIRQNTGLRLLTRSEVALRAGNFEKAADIARRYIDQEPDKWRGHYFLGKALLRLGRYNDAREAFDAADKLLTSQESKEITPLLGQADTYSLPASATLAKMKPQTPTEKVRRAIKQFGQANNILTNILRRIKTLDEKLALDVSQQLGLNYRTVSKAWRYLNGRLKDDLEAARASRQVDLAEEAEKQARRALANADKAASEAIRALLDVVRKDISRRPAARALVEVCIEQRDEESLAKARKAIMAADPPPPIAAMRLARYDLKERQADESPEQWRKRVAEFCQVLEGLLKDNPKETEVQVARADAALMLDDEATAKRICRDLLEAGSNDRNARLILAQVLTREGDHGEAMTLLLALTTENPEWVEAHYHYAHTAQAAGKRSLAREKMRQVTEFDPRHPGARRRLPEARRFLAVSLLQDKFPDQAFTDARKYHEARPDDPQAVWLLSETARLTNQPELARRTLGAAERDYGQSPRMLLVVADGYGLLGRKDDARAAYEKAAKATAGNPTDPIFIARALVQLDRAAEAEKLLLDKLADKPGQPEICNELGLMYRRSGRILQAIEQFNAAVRLNGQERRYRLALVRTLLDSGDLESAMTALEPMGNSDMTANLLLHRIREAGGQMASADEMQMLQQVSGSKQAGMALALTHHNSGRMLRCIEVCLAELEENPDAHDLRYLLGDAYRVMGRDNKCIEEWAKVLRAVPGQESIYQRIAAVLATTHKPAEVAKSLSELPGAETEMVELTTGWLHLRARDFKSAAAAYKRLMDRDKAPAYYRDRARLLWAVAMAADDRVEDAVAELDTMAKEKADWAVRASTAKANILLRAGHRERAIKALEPLRKTAADKRDILALLRLAEMHLRLEAVDEALAICEQAKQIQPKDARPFFAQAKILSAARRRTEALAPLRQAIALQPGNLDFRVALAQALDAVNRPQEALKTLKQLEETGPAGRVKALYERGRLLAGWGLPEQSADVLKQLAKIVGESMPAIQLALARALDELGQQDAARNRLEHISAYSPWYVQAQQLLARMAPKKAEKLNILNQLAEAKPGRSGILLQQMNVLLSQGRHKEALEAFRAFEGSRIEDPSRLQETYFLAFVAMLEADDPKAAVGLARGVAQRANLPRWRQMAVLVAIDADPTTAVELMAKVVDSNDPDDAYVGLALAVIRSDQAQGNIWADRAERIVAQLASADPPRKAPAHYPLLAALAAKRTEQARKALAAFDAAGAIERTAAKELFSYATQDNQGHVEAARLLQATLAADFGLGALSRKWATQVLSGRPKSQWAAGLVFSTTPGPDACRKLLKTLRPKDCTAARVIQAFLLDDAGRFDEAAEICHALAEQHKGDVRLLLDRAIAVEKTGDLVQALELYEQIQRDSPNPVAANNGAYLATQVPKDAGRPAKLAKAYKWMDSTVKANPQVAAFRETRGWLAFLLGRKDAALADLRQAIRGLRFSPDAHYHLAVVEADAGNTEMARWHFQASVNSRDAIKAKGRTPTKPEEKAADLAQKALDE